LESLITAFAPLGTPLDAFATVGDPAGTATREGAAALDDGADAVAAGTSTGGKVAARGCCSSGGCSSITTVPGWPINIVSSRVVPERGKPTRKSRSAGDRFSGI